ncbi:MAG: hypothetical protein LBU61_05465 [Coriobacteriales bacterium]|jgi:hypothetical protein|nr:hypothetical protein [Coriobacteriales bacterium]
MSRRTSIVNIGAILLISSAAILCLTTLIDLVLTAIRSSLPTDALKLISIFQIWFISIIPTSMVIIGLLMLAFFGLQANRANHSRAASPWPKRQSLADALLALRAVFAIISVVVTQVFIREIVNVMDANYSLFRILTSSMNYVIIFVAICHLIAQIVALYDASRVGTVSLVQGIVLVVLHGITLVGFVALGPVSILLSDLVGDIELLLFSQRLYSVFTSILYIVSLVVRATWALAIERQIARTNLD